MRYHEKKCLLVMRVTNDVKCFSFKFITKNSIESIKTSLKSVLKILSNNQSTKKITKSKGKKGRKRKRNN